MSYKRISPQPVVEGGTGAQTLTGVLIGNGTSAVTGNAVTQYDVLVGGASNAISSVGPGTALQVLQSGGNAANPAYSTATYPATTTINQLLYSSSANVVGGVTAGNYGVLISSSAGVPSWLANGTTGQILTATTAGTPSWAAAGSSSITITGDSGGGLTGNSFTFTGGTTGLTFAGAGSTETLGGTLAIANGGTNATSMATSTGIVKYDGTRLVTSSTATIDSSNRMTNTSQPAFRYYNLNNITNATGDATNVFVTFDTKSFEQGSNFASNIFTAPVTGIYEFISQISIYNLGAAHTTGLFSFICSNSAYTTNTRFNPATMRELGSGNNILGVTISQLASLSASDTMQVEIQVSGSTKTVGILGGSAGTYFTGHLVC